MLQSALPLTKQCPLIIPRNLFFARTFASIRPKQRFTNQPKNQSLPNFKSTHNTTAKPHSSNSHTQNKFAKQKQPQQLKQQRNNRKLDNQPVDEQAAPKFTYTKQDNWHPKEIKNIVGDAQSLTNNEGGIDLGATETTHSSATDDFYWQSLVRSFSEKTGLTHLNPLLLEEALTHNSILESKHYTPGKPILCNDRLAFLGRSVAELQLTEFYKSVLPRGASLAARICLAKKNLHTVGKLIGLESLLMLQLKAGSKYHSLPSEVEAIKLASATADTVLALVAADYLHHSTSATKPTQLFSHRYLIQPLTLTNLITEHQPRRVLDSYLRSRPRKPSSVPVQDPLAPQHPPPSTPQSTFAIYRVLGAVKGSPPHITVGVYVDGKLLATEYGISIKEAEEMAAVRALEILRSNALQHSLDERHP